MEAIVLSAGKGTRLRPLTKDKPKALIEFDDGESILDKQLNVLTQFDEIDSITIVVGYLSEMIEEKIRKDWRDHDIDTVYNPFVDESDNIVSLWLALLQTDGDFIITNGDNLFEPKVINSLLEPNSNGAYLTIDYKNSYDSDDMRVQLDLEGTVKWVSKEIPDEKTDAESIGIARFSGEQYTGSSKQVLEDLIRKDIEKENYWLRLFTELGEDIPVHPIEVPVDSWYEFDYHSDKEVFDTILQNKNTKL